MQNKIEVAKDEMGNYCEREFSYCPLWWHEKGLQQTATGYGCKLTTPYKVDYMGRKRRVYARCISNVSSLYVIIRGKSYFLGV
jgi:hypothetical protein